MAADNPGFVRVEQAGAELTVTATGPSAGSLRATLDDLLAGIAAAERAQGLNGERTDRRSSGRPG